MCVIVAYKMPTSNGVGKPKHSEEYKKRLSNDRIGKGNTMYGKSGKLSPTSKPVIIYEIVYDSITIAGKALGFSRKQVSNRINSKKYPSFQFV